MISFPDNAINSVVNINYINKILYSENSGCRLIGAYVLGEE